MAGVLSADKSRTFSAAKIPTFASVVDAFTSRLQERDVAACAEFGVSPEDAVSALSVYSTDAAVAALERDIVNAHPLQLKGSPAVLSALLGVPEAAVSAEAVSSILLQVGALGRRKAAVI
jgi:hypothetical protein